MIFIHCQETRLWELTKWSPKRKLLDLLSNSLSSFFKETYRDQFGEFVCRYWGLRVKLDPYYTYPLSSSFWAPILPVQLINLSSQEKDWKDSVPMDFQFLKKVIIFCILVFKLLATNKHLLYNFLAWFPSRFLTVLIHVPVHIALSFHKFLLFPPFPSFLPSLHSQTLICVFLSGFSLSFKVGL